MSYDNFKYISMMVCLFLAIVTHTCYCKTSKNDVPPQNSDILSDDCQLPSQAVPWKVDYVC